MIEKKALGVIDAPALPGFLHYSLCEGEYHLASPENRGDKLADILPGTYPYDVGGIVGRICKNIEQETLSTIYVLATALYFKHHYTYGHSRGVSNYAVAIGEVIGLYPERIAVLHTAGLLHDIGKIGISDEVLNKTSLLNEEEWQPVYSHPKLGVSILKHIDGLAACLPGIQYHHEHYDGSGYPSGLKGNNIPLDARIIAIADAYEAMTSPRPYREKTLTHEEALAELESNMGTQFDPELVKVFVEVMRKSSPVEAKIA